MQHAHFVCHVNALADASIVRENLRLENPLGHATRIKFVLFGRLCTNQNLTAEKFLDTQEFKKLLQTTHVSTASQPVFARSTVTVSGSEKRERKNMLMVQDLGFTLK